jgi:hypothetical protein
VLAIIVLWCYNNLYNAGGYMKIGNIETIHINGMEMLTVTKFAQLIHRSDSSIRRLLAYGNRYRKLKKLVIDGKPFIPLSELEKYPFTFQGRIRKLQDDIVYHYIIDVNEKTGLRVEHTDWYCSTANPIRCDLNCAECSFGRQVERVVSKDIVEDKLEDEGNNI